MPKTLRDYLYAALMLAAAVLLVVGGFVFRAAISFPGYISALLIFAVAAASFLAARELKPRDAEADMRALTSYLGRKKTDEKQTRIEPL